MNRNMPMSRLVREYWVDEICRLKGYSDKKMILNSEMCFACGLIAHKTERSHIKAAGNGGGHGVENLHMLCYACHVDSEFLYEGEYWAWFRKRTKVDGIISNALRGGYSISDNSGIREIVARLDLEEMSSVAMGVSFMVRQKLNERIAVNPRHINGIPYGYKLVDGGLVIDKEQMERVKAIFVMRSKRMGFEQIAKELNRLYGKREKHKRWNAGTIHYILKNKIYRGVK